MCVCVVYFYFFFFFFFFFFFQEGSGACQHPDIGAGKKSQENSHNF